MKLSAHQRHFLLFCALLSGCGTGGVSKNPVPLPIARWTPAPDVGALAQLWVGDSSGCAVETATDTPQITPNARQRRCSVVGWTSVVVAWTPDAPGSRRLKAHNEDPNTCVSERFAPKVEVLWAMAGNIVSEVISSLGGGPFDRAGLATTTHWTHPGGCDITISSRPSNQALNLPGAGAPAR